MKIIKESTENYGDAQFTLSDEDKKTIYDRIENRVYNNIGHNDTILSEDAKILIWLLKDNNSFKSETLIYCQTTLERVKYWLQS